MIWINGDYPLLYVKRASKRRFFSPPLYYSYIHNLTFGGASNTYKFYFCKWFSTSTKSLKEIVKPNLFFREQSIFENVYPALIVFPCHPCDVSKYIIVNYASTYVVNSEIIKAAMKNPIEYAFVTDGQGSLHCPQLSKLIFMQCPSHKTFTNFIASLWFPPPRTRRKQKTYFCWRRISSKNVFLRRCLSGIWKR